MNSDHFKELIRKAGEDVDTQILISDDNGDMHVAAYLDNELFWDQTFADLNDLTEMKLNNEGYCICANWDGMDIGIHFVKWIKINEYER